MSSLRNKQHILLSVDSTTSVMEKLCKMRSSITHRLFIRSAAPAIDILNKMRSSFPHRHFSKSAAPAMDKLKKMRSSFPQRHFTKSATPVLDKICKMRLAHMATVCTAIHVQTLIKKIRDGTTLRNDEIQYLVKEIAAGKVTDAQKGAISIAMDLEETASLRDAITKSGYDIQWVEDSLTPVPALGTSGEKVRDVQELIMKKRDGKSLDEDKIRDFIKHILAGEIKDAKIGEMLMAIYFKGLDDKETASLTQAMIDSGKVMQWPKEWEGLVVDKHSTGGVGDKVSLILVPALAACGVKVPMISGRRLNHTGGTLDKLESIPRFNVALTRQEMENALKTVGCCITGQTEDIAPADNLLYKKRDETCTVENDGLITGSIISKKASESLDALVLDVKVGKGAFKKDVDSARTLAQKMVEAAKSYKDKDGKSKIQAVALLTQMDTPLGNMIGNALEVAETIKCLHGDGPPDLIEVVVLLGRELLKRADKASSLQEAGEMLEAKLNNGEALAKFCEMMKAQDVEDDDADKLCQKGGDVFEILPKSEYVVELKAATSGYVHDLDAKVLADVAWKLEVGGETINFAVGLELLRSVGQSIKEGEPWIKIHHDDHHDELAHRYRDTLAKAIVIRPDPMEKATRLIEVVE